MLAERESWLLGALGRAIAGTLIDVGCGDANLARAIERASGRPHGYVGIDLLPGRIAVARTSVPWAALAVASADALPIHDGAADAVVASTLFSSLRTTEQRAAVAREIARTLKPGGRVVVYDLRYPSPANRAVRPVAVVELQRLFGGLQLVSARSLTLVPPLARSPFGGGARRYRTLGRIPMLRSHVGVVLERPQRTGMA